MNKLYFLIFLCAISLNGYSQIVDIPDANFKDALVNTFCVDTDGDGIGDIDADTNNDGEIQVIEAEDVLWLNVRNRNIGSLEGINSFINLEYLHCAGNPLTSLDVTQNPNLEWLGCFYNQLTSLDVTQNPNLEHLDCGGNSLTSLNVTQNANLKILFCDQNQLTNLDFAQNPNLETVYCYLNLLTNINVTQNPNLEFLMFNDNLMTSLDVSQNPNLEALACWDNELTSLDVTQNPNLEDLAVSGSLLTSLDLSMNSNLEVLRCVNNLQLTSLNIKNGNNINMGTMHAQNNPNLACIQVDNKTAIYPVCDAPYGWCKDSNATYSEECELGVVAFENINPSIYPNPVQNSLSIKSGVPFDTVKIYSFGGQIIKSVQGSEIDVSNLSSGMYFAILSRDGQSVAKRFVKE